MLLDFLTLEENLHLFSRVTRKVLSNSKHTLLCLYGHHVLARVNLIPLKTLQWFAQWLEAQSLQGPAHFLATKGWTKCIPAYHTFYMSYDKNVNRMTSMHIFLGVIFSKNIWKKWYRLRWHMKQASSGIEACFIFLGCFI